jgi:predicted DNA-binding transcriptional regulator AlpA
LGLSDFDFINQRKAQMTKETYYSEKCVAKKWGLSRKTLQRWRLTNEGPQYVRISNRVRYSESAIKKYEEENFLDKKSKNQGVQDGR